MEFAEKMAADIQGKNDENHTMLRSLDQLSPESKNRSKKTITAIYFKDMQTRLSDSGQSAGVGRLHLLLDEMTRPRRCREGKDQNEGRKFQRHLTKFNWLSIWKKRAAENKTLLHSK